MPAVCRFTAYGQPVINGEILLYQDQLIQIEKNVVFIDWVNALLHCR